MLPRCAMMMDHSHVLGFLGLLLTILFGRTAWAQPILLVDFGSSAATNTFGLAGWTTVLASADMAYSAEGPGGLRVSTDPDEYRDYQGIRGGVRTFRKGERIVVTWYNSSDEEISFTSRISFTDPDAPDGGLESGAWFTMRRFDDYRVTFSRVAPHSLSRTAFHIETHGVHKTDEAYSLININLAIEWGDNSRKSALLCDRIELLNDADTTAPEAPTGLTASVLSNSRVALRWNNSMDNSGTVGYLVYLDGEPEVYSVDTKDTVALLEASHGYRFSVSALDHCGNESRRGSEIQVTTLEFPAQRTDLIRPSALSYLGAVRLPESANYGGEALAYSPEGDGGQQGSGAVDGFPGSLFTTNNIGPESGFIGEIDIPTPKISSSIEELNEARVLQDFVNIRPSAVNAWPFVDIWNLGLAWFPGPPGGTLFSTWSYYYQVSAEKTASVSMTRAMPLLGSPRHGPWFVHTSSAPLDAALNDYLCVLPLGWASLHTGGRRLVTGRNREGGLSGLGPSLWAFSAPEFSAPPMPNTELSAMPLLQYGPVEQSAPHSYPNAFVNYHHADWFRAAAWVDAGNRSALVLYGMKGRGDSWYGYTGEHMSHDWVIADVPYPDFADTDPDGKGWRGHDRIPMLIFYDPQELALVASGSWAPHRPQPYAALRLPRTVLSRTTAHLRDATYDALNHLLYAVEMAPDFDGRVLVHAWRVNTDPVSVPQLLDDSWKNNLDIYPQPAQDRFSVNLPDNMQSCSLALFDALGREVRFSRSGTTIQLLGAVSPGIYRLVVHTDHETLIQSVAIVK